MPLHPAAVSLSLSLLLSAVPAHARPAPASHHPSRHHGAGAASELLSADDLNAMVLSILGGQPQPALSGSEARRQRMQAVWARLRGLLGGGNP